MGRRHERLDDGESPTDRRAGGPLGRPRLPDHPFSVVYLVFAIFLTACGPETPGVANGDLAPGFALQHLDGHPVSFPGDMEGRVVAIRFWADWCPFCEGEMRSIEPVFRTYREQGLTVLAINVRQDPETAARFIESLAISYDVLLDEDGAVARSYGVSALPTTFFVDRRGKLVTRILGESTPEILERIVKDML